MTPGDHVQINSNIFESVGAVTLEPGLEASDTDLEICHNTFRDVDATNILVRAREGVTVDTVRVCNNSFRDAGLTLGKGFIAVGESAGSGYYPAVMRNVIVSGNVGRGWGKIVGILAGPYVGPSIGIQVAGATHGSFTENVEVAFNDLSGLIGRQIQPSNGYGIFIRNNTDGFDVHDNVVSFTGRSCVATTYATDGRIASNLCTYPVRWSTATRPAPASQGCYQVDIATRNITLEGNVCENPGTPASPSNGFFVADSHTVDTAVIRGNTVRITDALRSGMLRDYAIGGAATNVVLQQ